MNSVLRLGSLAALAMAIAPSAAHAVVNWTNPSGIALSFSWSNGYSNNGYFGDPTIVGNTFVFTPTTFSATRGVNDTRTDTLQVDLTAAAGQFITGVIIREFGTRSHTSGTTVQSTMFIYDTDASPFPQFQDPLSFSFDNSTNPLSWSGIATRNNLQITNMQLSLTNSLSAFLTGRSIAKTRVEIEILPSPGGLGLLAGAGLLATARRRRA
jgi:hypothetical protein